MSREKADYIPIENIQINGQLLRSIKYKPIFGSFVLVIFGILSLIMEPIFAKILGAILVLMGMFVLIFVKDEKVMDVYDDGIVVYQKGNNQLAMFIHYNNVTEWSVQRSSFGTQVIAIILKGNRYVYKDTFVIQSIRRLFVRLMPDKEINTKR